MNGYTFRVLINRRLIGDGATLPVKGTLLEPTILREANLTML